MSLTADGTFDSGEFVSTYMNGAGRPVPDDDKRGLDLLQGLCRSDFPGTGARLDDDGKITAPSE